MKKASLTFSYIVVLAIAFLQWIKIENNHPSFAIVVAGNTHAFIDIEGNEIDVELGQATDDVLMAQTGSLVYYLTLVNDVYAYFLTASKNNVMSGIHLLRKK